MPIEPLAFRGKPIILVGEPEQAFHDRKNEVFSYDFEPFNPYDWRNLNRQDWAILIAKEMWSDVSNISALFDLKRSICGDLVILADLISLGLQSVLNELAEEPEALEYFRDKIIEAVAR